jgi:hypothetical protein
MKDRFATMAALALIVVSGLTGVAIGATTGPTPALASGVIDYAGGNQTVTATGTTAGIDIEAPAQVPSGDHSLMEIAADRCGNCGDTIEVGWTVDPNLNGDSHPHLFGYTWKNGSGQGYNAANPAWVDDTTNATNLGADLNSYVGGAFKVFSISYQVISGTGRWYLFFDNKALGYYLASNWTSTFTTTGFQQYFGEVSAPTTSTPCDDMGSGALPGGTSPARIASVTLQGTTTPASLTLFNTSSTTYDAAYNAPTTTRSIKLGGPGYC